MVFIPDNPLVNVYITMENHHFQWVNQLRISIAISNSYVAIEHMSFDTPQYIG